jgi:MarR family transcriptional regulator, lower aerobic nicotinate degradation pathway regulator
MTRKRTVSRSPTPTQADSAAFEDRDPSIALAELAMDGPAPYLIRRLQQVVSSIFADEMGRFEVTAPQYAVLSVVVAVPNLDQNTAAFAAGVERTTIVGVINRLAKKGMLKRSLSKTDKRVRLLQPTDAGIRFVRQVSEAIDRISIRLLEPLTVQQREAFCETIKTLLRKRLSVEARDLVEDRLQLRRESVRHARSGARQK